MMDTKTIKRESENVEHRPVSKEESRRRQRGKVNKTLAHTRQKRNTRLQILDAMDRFSGTPRSTLDAKSAYSIRNTWQQLQCQ